MTKDPTAGRGIPKIPNAASLVTDSLGKYDRAYLRCCFKDAVLPFKEYFVVNLGRPMTTFVHANHRGYVRKALQNVRVERCYDATRFVDE